MKKLDTIDSSSPARISLMNSILPTQQYPLVSVKSRSFKEIAIGLVNQLEFLEKHGHFSTKDSVLLKLVDKEPVKSILKS